MQEISFCTLEDQCPYLENKKSKMEYKYIEKSSKNLNQELIMRGWRRFGKYYSRPICDNCNECLSLRINTFDYVLSKSDKRVINKNLNTKIIMTKPNISNEHMYLYDKYHKFMENKRSWKRYDLNFRQYFNLYVEGAFDFGYELDFYIGDDLVCVDLIDFLDDGISSIYCFYDPSFLKFSLGKFSLLSEIILAKNKNLKYIYLGYFVKECQSLLYKSDYMPNEILKNTSDINEIADLWELYNNANNSNIGICQCKH